MKKLCAGLAIGLLLGGIGTVWAASLVGGPDERLAAMAQGDATICAGPFGHTAHQLQCD